MPIPLNIHIFERGLAGVPSLNYLGDLKGRIDSYQHSTTDSCGFESASVTFKATVTEAKNWLQNGIGRRMEADSPSGRRVWEGLLVGITATIGQEQRSVTIEQMANRIRCVYSTVLSGNPGTTPSISDTGSQALYGIKDMVLSAGVSDPTEAGYYAAVTLARLAYPQSGPTTNVTTGDLGEVSVTLSFAGWYVVLGWLITSNSTTSTAVTTTQVATLLSNYAAINNFFDTTALNITASGISTTQKIEANTAYREAIEQRLGYGTGANRLTWGFYEKRQFYVQPYMGATPTVIAYQRYLGDSRVYNLGRAVVEPWDVRPNNNYQVVELLDVGPVTGAPNTASRFYVARVTCTISGDSIGCTLEPEEAQDLSAILISKYGR